MRLDEDKLEALRSWGERLRNSGGEESAAVGRAILMLIEEIDQLHIDLWHARLQETEPEPVPTEPEPAPSDKLEEKAVTSSLHARLRRALRHDSDSAAPQLVEKATAQREPDDTASPQEWIDALRRQK